MGHLGDITLPQLISFMGAACLKFNVGKCGAFMEKSNIGAFRNSLDPDETPQKAASHQGLRYLPDTFLVTLANIKTYMNQDLFHFVNG